jgi:hypothetical protein
MDGQIRQNLTVHLHACFFQAVNQFALIHDFHPGVGVDPDNPQAAKVPLFIAPVTEGIS